MRYLPDTAMIGLHELDYELMNLSLFMVFICAISSCIRLIVLTIECLFESCLLSNYCYILYCILLTFSQKWCKTIKPYFGDIKLPRIFLYSVSFLLLEHNNEINCKIIESAYTVGRQVIHFPPLFSSSAFGYMWYLHLHLDIYGSRLVMARNS